MSEDKHEFNLSLSGCGFMGIYHIGVISAFKQYAPDVISKKICGASAGALCAACILCDCCPGEMCSDVLEIAVKARSRFLGPLNPNFKITDTLREGLNRILPINCHRICTNRLTISVTRCRDGQNVLVDTFSSKEDLIQGLICSSFVPYYSGFSPPKWRNECYWDGSLSNNNPKNDNFTITVAPFSAEVDISPPSQLEGENLKNHHHINFSGTNMCVTEQNIYRLLKGLFPPQPFILKRICLQGYKDAIRFLKEKNRILNCSCASNLEEASMIRNIHMRKMMERQRNEEHQSIDNSSFMRRRNTVSAQMNTMGMNIRKEMEQRKKKTTTFYLPSEDVEEEPSDENSRDSNNLSQENLKEMMMERKRFLQQKRRPYLVTPLVSETCQICNNKNELPEIVEQLPESLDHVLQTAVLAPKGVFRSLYEKYPLFARLFAVPAFPWLLGTELSIEMLKYIRTNLTKIHASVGKKEEGSLKSIARTKTVTAINQMKDSTKIHRTSFLNKSSELTASMRPFRIAKILLIFLIQLIDFLYFPKLFLPSFLAVFLNFHSYDPQAIYLEKVMEISPTKDKSSKNNTENEMSDNESLLSDTTDCSSGFCSTDDEMSSTSSDFTKHQKKKNFLENGSINYSYGLYRNVKFLFVAIYCFVIANTISVIETIIHWTEGPQFFHAQHCCSICEYKMKIQKQNRKQRREYRKRKLQDISENESSANETNLKMSGTSIATTDTNLNSNTSNYCSRHSRINLLGCVDHSLVNTNENDLRVRIKSYENVIKSTFTSSDDGEDDNDPKGHRSISNVTLKQYKSKLQQLSEKMKKHHNRIKECFDIFSKSNGKVVKRFRWKEMSIKYLSVSEVSHPISLTFTDCVSQELLLYVKKYYELLIGYESEDELNYNEIYENIRLLLLKESINMNLIRHLSDKCYIDNRWCYAVQFVDEKEMELFRKKMESKRISLNCFMKIERSNEKKKENYLFHFTNLPWKWFINQSKIEWMIRKGRTIELTDLYPNEKNVKSFFEYFGEIQHLDIPLNDECRTLSETVYSLKHQLAKEETSIVATFDVWVEFLSLRKNPMNYSILRKLGNVKNFINLFNESNEENDKYFTTNEICRREINQKLYRDALANREKRLKLKERLNEKKLEELEQFRKAKEESYELKRELKNKKDEIVNLHSIIEQKEIHMRKRKEANSFGLKCVGEQKQAVRFLQWLFRRLELNMKKKEEEISMIEKENKKRPDLIKEMNQMAKVNEKISGFKPAPFPNDQHDIDEENNKSIRKIILPSKMNDKVDELEQFKQVEDDDEIMRNQNDSKLKDLPKSISGTRIDDDETSTTEFGNKKYKRKIDQVLEGDNVDSLSQALNEMNKLKNQMKDDLLSNDELAAKMTYYLQNNKSQAGNVTSIEDVARMSDIQQKILFQMMQKFYNQLDKERMIRKQNFNKSINEPEKSNNQPNQTNGNLTKNDNQQQSSSEEDDDNFSICSDISHYSEFENTILSKFQQVIPNNINTLAYQTQHQVPPSKKLNEMKQKLKDEGIVEEETILSKLTEKVIVDMPFYRSANIRHVRPIPNVQHPPLPQMMDDMRMMRMRSMPMMRPPIMPMLPKKELERIELYAREKAKEYFKNKYEEVLSNLLQTIPPISDEINTVKRKKNTSPKKRKLRKKSNNSNRSNSNRSNSIEKNEEIVKKHKKKMNSNKQKKKNDDYESDTSLSSDDSSDSSDSSDCASSTNTSISSTNSRQLLDDKNKQKKFEEEAIQIAQQEANAFYADHVQHLIMCRQHEKFILPSIMRHRMMMQRNNSMNSHRGMIVSGAFQHPRSFRPNLRHPQSHRNMRGKTSTIPLGSHNVNNNNMNNNNVSTSYPRTGKSTKIRGQPDGQVLKNQSAVFDKRKQPSHPFRKESSRKRRFSRFFRHFRNQIKFIPLNTSLTISLASYGIYNYIQLKRNVLYAKQLDYAQHHNFIADVVEVVAPGVVFIEHKSGYFSRSNGSGFIIESDGLILTNAHVVTNSKYVRVRLSDDRTFDGKVIFLDPKNDLAAVRIEAKNLPIVKLGSSSNLRSGEFVIAIGSPLSLTNTVTSGIVSNVGRQGYELGLNKDVGFIQTDAAITFGNSGGPLVNLNGEAIGICNMKVTSGISFAIPIDVAKNFINLSKDKYYSSSSSKQQQQQQRPIYLGMRIFAINEAIASELSIRMQSPVTHGVYVHSIHVGGLAANNNIEPGDIIIEMNGRKVTNVDDIFNELKIGNEKIQMRILRNGNEFLINISPFN
ncbi:hypothetical protein SNEBB_011035 [Seison nebaliae]|nr:hypothetical protein SNEBB_011035 [Seison nebaliae]